MDIKKATLLGMLLAFGLSICSTYAVTVRDNKATFFTVDGMAVSFEWNGSYCITAGQPWGDSDHPNAVYMDNNTGTLDIWCGRQKSSPVADYFNSLAPTGSNTWGSSISSMNFAIQGTLTINSDKYFVVIGQVGYSNDNIWVIGGQNFSYDSFWSNDSHYDAVVTPDGKYLICSIQGSDSSFTVWLNTNNAQSN